MTDDIKEHGFLFSADMIHAFLRKVNAKSQTRRDARSPRNSICASARLEDLDWSNAWPEAQTDNRFPRCDKWKVPHRDGDTVHQVWPRVAPAGAFDAEPDPSMGYTPPATRVYAKETWRIHFSPGLGLHLLQWRADGETLAPVDMPRVDQERWAAKKGWQPSIFMPRVAARFVFDVAATRAERVNDISADDAQLEGVSLDHLNCSRSDMIWIGEFRRLWDGLHDKPGDRFDDGVPVWAYNLSPMTKEQSDVN